MAEIPEASGGERADVQHTDQSMATMSSSPAQSSLPSANSLRILSLDGGGVKGYTSLLILQRIFRQIKNEQGLAKMPLPRDVFDLIIGTSTGGIIAVMLGRLGMSIEDCLKHYRHLGTEVFVGQVSKAGKLARTATSLPFYDIRRLQAVIKNVLRERKVPVDEPFCIPENARCKV